MNKKAAIWGAALLLLAAAGAASYFVWHKNAQVTGTDAAGGPGGKKGMGAGMGPTPVQARKVVRGDIDVTIDGLGTVTALNTAIVKARVAGPLNRINFQEGQQVNAGDVLAEIDPRPYQALLDQALGQLARDQALLAAARVDLERYRILLKKDSIAAQQVDDQEWLVKQYEGTVVNDKGSVDSARLQLDFTRISAPISGRLGLRQVDVGNYVQTTDTNGVVVVTQTHPIFVVFTIPAARIKDVVPRLRKGLRLPVKAYDQDGKNLLSTGQLMSVDNQVDVTTGTVKLKAQFANDDDHLFPNQFVNVRLGVDTLKDRLLAPQAAIQRGSQGAFFYAVGNDGSVQVKPVQLGAFSDDVVAFEGEIDAGTQVVIDGADKLRNGARVIVTVPGGGLTDAGTTGSRRHGAKSADANRDSQAGAPQPTSSATRPAP